MHALLPPMPLLPLPQSLALFNAASSRAIETAAADPALMERAGLAGAKLALALLASRDAAPVWVVCGPGNNGGDGLVVARHLHGLGRALRVSLLADPQRLPADAAQALRDAVAAGVTIDPGVQQPTQRPALVVDALLGLGLNRAPDARLGQAIQAMQGCGAPILALDLPSGLLADTGQPAGSAAVRADHTLALLTLKPGLFTGEGRAHGGRLWFDALGVRPERCADALLLGADAALDLSRPVSSHKGRQGAVRVIGGAAGMQGAARLAARAALVCGAGRVYLDLLDDADGGPADPAQPELMRWREGALAPSDAIVVAGCGGGEAVAAALPALLRQVPRLVLDADALNALAADAGLAALLRRRAAFGLSSLLTPHPLEAARLLRSTTGAVQTDRLAAAQELSRRMACSVVLKGSGSVIAIPGELPAINSSGGPALATAGTGDVLAGWLGGLWAQRPLLSPHAIACCGVYAHGRAGEASTSLIAGELIERLRG